MTVRRAKQPEGPGFRRPGVSVTGTVGLILKGKQAGVIPAIRPLLDTLDANQFRIGEELRAEALRLAGE